MIYDEQGNLLDHPDLTKGRLIDETRTVYHSATEGVPEQSHLQVMATYSNGGMDVQRIIDVPGIPSMPAWTETVHDQLYVPYSDAELREIEKAKTNTIEARLDQQEAALIELAALLIGGEPV